MSIVPFFVISLAIYCGPMVFGGFAISWFFKVRFKTSFFVDLLLPVCLWSIGAYIFLSKSLSNLVLEPLVLVGAVLVVASVFAALNNSGKLDDRAFRRWFPVAGLVCALTVLLLFPQLSE